jgi:hypothetical protein
VDNNLESVDSDSDSETVVAISHRSRAAKKTFSRSSHAPSPSYAPVDDDVPDDVDLNPQTTEGRSAPHKFSRKP